MSNVAITAPASHEVWQAPDWQRLWLAALAQKKRWRSLALVPAGPGVAPATLVQIALSLARTGMVHTGSPIHVADATRLTLAQLEPFSDGLAYHVRSGEMMVLALAPLSENVTSLSLAKSADRALLCVVLGQMDSTEAKKTVAQIGASHFIGSAVFRMPEP